MIHVWLRRLAVLTAMCAFAQAFTVWKFSIAVPILSTALAVALQAKDSRPWMRLAGWLTAIVAILAAAAPAGLTHTFAQQILPGIAVAVAAGQVFRIYAFDGWLSRGPALPIAITALVAQIGLGAAVAQGSAGVMAHVAGAAVATLLVMWAALAVLVRNMDTPRLRRPAMALLSLTFSQVFLGLGSYLASLTSGAFEISVLAWFIPAHAMAGSLALGSAVLLMMLLYGHVRQSGTDMAHGGVAVA